MSDGFDDLITRSNSFFTQLSNDNTKAFYEAHKAMYNAEIKKPAELLADLLAEDITKATCKPHKPKVFRIHRDVRFSKDKTPYNAHLHLMWTRPGHGPAWFFGASPDYVVLGMGIMGLEKDSLTTYRNMIDQDGDELSDEIEAAQTHIGAQIGTWGPEPLKRVPKPFDQDHPHADLLKRKSLTLSADLPDGWQDVGLLKTLNKMIPAMMPMWAILNQTFPG